MGDNFGAVIRVLAVNPGVSVVLVSSDLDERIPCELTENQKLDCFEVRSSRFTCNNPFIEPCRS